MSFKHLALFGLAAAIALSPLQVRAADAKEAAELAKKVAEGDAAERDSAERKLRDMGKDAVQPLRDIKTDKEEATTRVRTLLTDIAIDVAKIDAADAGTLHEIAREEGKGKRYSNAERAYRRAEQLFDKLKDDADTRRDKVKEQTYEDKRRICDRMKDKAARKLKGQTHTGVNLGFVRVGKDHDNSDDWE
jgi:hypothetical protein